MPYHGTPDGTWEVFATRINAERYALAAWMLALRRRAAQGDGTLRNALTNLRERIVDEWPDSLADLRAMLLAMNAAELQNLRNRLDQLPWFGSLNDVDNESEGFTLTWDRPHQTSTGEWAVESFLGGGVPKPIITG